MKRIFDKMEDFTKWCKEHRFTWIKGEVNATAGEIFKGTEYAGSYGIDIRNKKVEVTIHNKHIPNREYHLFR